MGAMADVQKLSTTATICISIVKYTVFLFFIFHGATAPSGPGPPHYRGFMITLRHTTLGRTPLDE
jgi:hypothetical protein